jgi:hypothetical protein
MPGLAALIANPAVNIIQIFAQFGVQTTAAQPKLSLGFVLTPNAGGAAFTTGTTCFGSFNPAPTVPGGSPYTLYGNLIRGVHFNNTTTNIAISFSADTTPTGAVITLLNNDDNAGTPTSPVIVVSALGLM